MMIGVDFAEINKTTRYQLLCSAVVPRPIAFISTIDTKTGIKNLAPLSFFNCVTSEPPTVMFSLTRKHDGSKKDTLVNIENEKDFVINHVTREIFPQVFDASAEMPADEDEFNVVGLTAVAGVKVKSPRVKESPIHIECELYNAMEVGDGNYGSATIIVGKVLYMHMDESLYHNGILNTSSITTISRLGNMSYGYAEQKFDIESDIWNVSKW
ncbi:unnamed protein product [Rotaria magnacalcarata]|uniref:Flavin reductase like domain-containing protein n=2 Tax=Rotaria magnacalcarata TaxID=392030 RepID=A0A816EI77_9BILA|nr:unnamed protein product [Rotaria magnacalcarata]CAF1647038.1 unnamed protein product [Rotaria magnacalcarata]CAF2095323.1 unnamed protein product [Rotaria magnacalcarata]CAF2175954.1 unnamed protein product [Rotaria magnacalcarata]